MVLCKAMHMDSFDDLARVVSQLTGALVNGLLRVHVESVTLLERRQPSASIVSVPVSVLYA